MELFKYYVFFGEFKKKKYYVLEKPKIFVTRDGRRRFKKMDVGTIVDSVGDVAFLTLFDDDERASKELTRFYKNQQKRLEEINKRKINEIDERIATLQQQPKTEVAKPWD